MSVREDKIREFALLVEAVQPVDGYSDDLLKNVMPFRSSESYPRKSIVYKPGIILCAQSEKSVYLNGKPYNYGAGEFLALFMPMVMECEVKVASKENPMLGLGIFLDWSKVAKMILKMEQVEPLQEVNAEPSGVINGRIKDNMLDAVLKLLRVMQSPLETAVLGESLVDEIYFRLLSEEQGGALKYLLQQRGQIQQISKAVEYVQENLKEVISVDAMADVVNMSSSGFHKKFKEVMHVSPLQYVKAIKLNKAKEYLLEGKNVSEAGYKVGYNSLAQFSREFKRYFGTVPSEVF